MTVRINKEAINLREKLSELDKPSGLVGEELLRADTSADAREALNLEEHLFEEFESTGIDDNATSTKVTVSDTGVDVTGTITADSLTVEPDTGNTIVNIKGGGDNSYSYLRMTSKIGGTENYSDIYTDYNASFIFKHDNGNKLASFDRTGDVSFYEDTGTTAKFVWDASAERLGIGTSSPIRPLSVQNTGTTMLAEFKNPSNTKSFISFANSASSADQVRIGSDSNSLVLSTNYTERARIDSSGNLLVGKTTTSNSTVGAELNASGQIVGTFAGGTHILGRNTNDGSILEFQKDGSTVGSIGTVYGDMITGTGDVGVRWEDNNDSLTPWNPSTNFARGSAISLGASTVPFKDLYLSGGVITSSDYRLKEDVQPMQSYADTIKQMNLVNFAWKDSGEREDGFIAHELQSLVPSAVRGDKDAIDEDGNEQYQGVDPLKLIPVLTKALQEALERIETLENK